VLRTAALDDVGGMALLEWRSHGAPEEDIGVSSSTPGSLAIFSPEHPMTRDEAAKQLPCLKRQYLLLGGFFVGGVAIWALTLLVLVLWAPKSAAAASKGFTQQVMRFAFVPPMVLAAAATILHFHWRGRLRASAARANFRLCPHCRYDLGGAAQLDAAAGLVRCPECGHEVDVVRTQELWWAWTEWPIVERKH
ncbi:MAG: hypothetical protein ACREJO_16020, partial [Phycisphaerales bacterium]